MQRDLPCFSSPFVTVARTGIIDQDLPHYLSGDGKKMRAIPPVLLPGINQPDVRFIDQGGRLQDVILPFEFHVTVSDPVQFGIDRRD